jgi:ATP-dependent helicase HrpA
MLALPEQYKYARKRFAAARELVLLGQGFNTHKALADGLAERVFAERFLAAETASGSAATIALPRSAAEFAALLDSKRAEFGDVVDRVESHATATLQEARGVRAKLAALQSGPSAAVADIQKQLDTLLPVDFPEGVASDIWSHLPRYLKALNRRLDKLTGNAKRDADLMAQVTPFTRALVDVSKNLHEVDRRPELERLRWMIEEYRVSLFAQDLRTALPVSDKRLAEQVEKARAEAAAV